MPNLNDYVAEAHRANAKWWVDINRECEHCHGSGETHMGNWCRICGGTGHPGIQRNVGELIALMHGELSEALEAARKDLMDDKIPTRKGFEVELADCVIRIFDACGGFGLDLEGAYQDKLRYNRDRFDHSIEHRQSANGKKY